MRRLALAAALGIACFAARADEKAQNAVRSTATVEVIDDAAQVDEIIARVRAKQAATPRPPAPPKRDGEAAKGTRAVLPPAPVDDKVDEKARQRDKHPERGQEPRRERREEREARERRSR
jgi:hypothetical protein